VVKLGLTSLDLLALVKELESVLISARIENVYQLDGGSFLFRFHAKSGQANLIVEPGRRLNLTRVKYRIPAAPTAKALALRRLLSSAKVEGVGQVDFDRILHMDASRGGERLRIYFELFGSGNIVVTGPDGTIRYTLLTLSMKDRTVKVGYRYSPPPQRGQDLFMPLEAGAIRSKVSLVRSLTRALNAPAEVVEEALLRASLNPGSPSEVSQEELNSFLASARALVEEVRDGRFQPNIVLEDGRYSTVLPVAFRQREAKRFETFNEAVDEYFSAVRAEGAESGKRSPIEQKLEDLQAILSRQAAHAGELEEEKARYSAAGKLILANLGTLQPAIERVLSARKAGEGWAGIESSVRGLGVESLDHSKGTMTVSLGGQKLEIDFRQSATRNAEERFARSKEAAKKLEGLRAAMAETEAKMRELREGLIKVAPDVTVKAMKRAWYERFRWTLSSGFLILGGKDATQNEILVKKHMGPKDVFAHSDLPGGSVVIVKSEGRDIPDRVKADAVAFAVAYSRAWRAGLGVSDGYWVGSEQVTKTPPSGEYLGKGAFMIYGTRNYVRNIPLSLLLGVRFSEGAFGIIVGGEEFVKGSTPSYAVLTPGALKGADLAEKVREAAAGRAPSDLERRIIRAIPDGEIGSVVPPGGCSVA